MAHTGDTIRELHLFSQQGDPETRSQAMAAASTAAAIQKLQGMTVAQLKDVLRQSNMRLSGRKQDHIDRIEHVLVELSRYDLFCLGCSNPQDTLRCPLALFLALSCLTLGRNGQTSGDNSALLQLVGAVSKVALASSYVFLLMLRLPNAHQVYH